MRNAGLLFAFAFACPCPCAYVPCEHEHEHDEHDHESKNQEHHQHKPHQHRQMHLGSMRCTYGPMYRPCTYDATKSAFSILHSTCMPMLDLEAG